jgi:outer membrane protein OmpA-like peptidoglycan-associated protein
MKFCLSIGFAFVLFVILLPSLLLAQTTGAGSTSTNFQKIPMGARAVGMGESFTAVADDPTAMYWNPAGLIQARGTEFNLTHGVWLEGVDSEYFSFSENMDTDGAIGGSLNYLGTGSFDGALETSSGGYGGVGPSISAAEYEGSIAYAQRLGNWIPGGGFFQNLRVGLEASVVGQNVVNLGYSAVAFNLGLLYEAKPKTFFLGAMLSNIGSTFPATILNNATGATTIQNFAQPFICTFAGSYWLKNTFMKKDRMIIASDVDVDNDTGLKASLGDEYRMRFGANDVFLRGGYRTGSDLGTVDGLALGAGVAHRFDDVEADVDYAFVPYGILGDTHRISVNIIVGEPPVLLNAKITATSSFVLGDQSALARFATRSEEPLDKWRIAILDSDGQIVRSLSGAGNPPPQFPWDGRNEAGELVPHGDYTVHLQVADTEGHETQAVPRTITAQWVPKKVPYQYNFQVSGDLLFDSGQDVLQPRGFTTLEQTVLSIRQKYQDCQITIAGHTDNQNLSSGAKFASNDVLSLARATAVKNYLVQQGMDPNHLSVMGYGDTKPVATNDTPEGRAKNRRVELIVTGVKVETAPEMVEEGMPLYAQRNFKEALGRFLMATEADERYAPAYRSAGDCYLNLGDKDKAIWCYRKAVKYDPTDTTLKAWLNQYDPNGGAPASSSLPALLPAPGSN